MGKETKIKKAGKAKTAAKGRVAKVKGPAKVEGWTHPADSRVNIPTAANQGFMHDADARPRAYWYARNRDLDPQLVWRGKDAEGAQMQVDSVPIYIQEKIHPQHIIHDLRRMSAQARGADHDTPDLFADFNGLPDDEARLDFYRHDLHWSNRMILGDSLLVMNSLATRENLKGQVQAIFFDPPYGIKFNSNWQVSTKSRDVKDGKAESLPREAEVIRAFRDTWEKGIHSYLSYLRDRFILMRELLKDSGSIFVQIGDENVHRVRSLLDEVFGAENFVSQITIRKTTSEGSVLIGATSDFIIWYSKDISKVKYRTLYIPRSEDSENRYNQKDMNGNSYTLADITSSRSAGEGDLKEFTWENKTYNPGKGTFKTTLQGLVLLGKAKRLEVTGKNKLRYKRFANDFGYAAVANLWSDISGAVQSRSDPKIYVVQTATSVIQRCLLMATDPGDLVLDPTCGSGTTAYVAEQWGRRWITIDTSRVALALARTRIMAARYPYYLLADSPDGVMKEAELTGKPPHTVKTQGDLRRGFVYKRVPHITLKSIANNAEIDLIYDRWQTVLEPLRAELNKALQQKWEEWDIPRAADDAWPDAVRQIFEQWWDGRRQRQTEIDAAIARAADIEYLYDQPFEAKNAVRVAGPFTVESLSPHKLLPIDENDDWLADTLAEMDGQKASDRKPVDQGGDEFAQMVLENLKLAGVQNSRKKERLVFSSMRPWPGRHIQAEGRYEENGREMRAAICIGPEYGMFSYRLLRSAASEANDGNFDTLILCGFAFEAQLGDDTMQFGRLNILKARMNQDLHMADHLRKTNAGNLFVVFGEPEIEVTEEGDQLRVEIKGVDIFDPTTGQVRSGGVEDIACWFIDTDYDKNSFFVRHAYFLGANDPYDNLKRVMKAEIDEAAWSSLNSAVSRPFPRPQSGMIAVKVINHYGDEVLKVYRL